MAKKIRTWVIGSLIFFFSISAFAGEAVPLADNPETEKRLVKISSEMRCLVCQNESLAGSQADLAVDLRRVIREMIEQGKSDAQITDFLVSRYSDFILYRPPLKMSTVVLWFGPPILLITGLIILLSNLRRRNAKIESGALSTEQQAQVERLLQGQEDK